jgi:DNA gyrase subunit A
MLEDIDKNTVDFQPNFDDRLQEPTVLPSKIPNLLVNGSSGIAVGMATNIPPHNLREICSAIEHLVDKPAATVPNLMQFVSGPDFPTGGYIYGVQGLKEAYQTGRGKVVMRARAQVEEKESSGKAAIVVTELPYQVNKANLAKDIADLVNDKKLEGISAVRDESDRDGMRLVIELKRDAIPHVVLKRALQAHHDAVDLRGHQPGAGEGSAEGDGPEGAAPSGAGPAFRSTRGAGSPAPRSAGRGSGLRHPAAAPA